MDKEQNRNKSSVEEVRKLSSFKRRLSKKVVLTREEKWLVGFGLVILIAVFLYVAFVMFNYYYNVNF